MSILSAQQWQAVAQAKTDEIERLIRERDAARRNTDTARRDLARLHQALTRIAARHAADDEGSCWTCRESDGASVEHPCPDYRDATGATP